MVLVNLTGHEVVLKNRKESYKVYPPSGTIIRTDVSTCFLAELDGYPVCGKVLDHMNSMPDPKPGTVYIVSSLARYHLKLAGRTDIVSPDVSTAKRNEDGSVKWVTGWRF